MSNCQKLFSIKSDHPIIPFHSQSLAVKENNSRRRPLTSNLYCFQIFRRYVAATHFEPTGARLAFPCWDEPDFKATFDISITHSKSYNAISNTKKKNVTIENGKYVSKFDTTPKMSTYLVAFVVSDYKSNNRTENEIEFKVWTKPHAVNQTEHALNVSVDLLKRLDDYMKIPYGNEIKKMDQVSLKDFSAGAMENWGLVTYR